MANSSPSSFLCGVIEGFYGPLWTHTERLQLLRSMPEWRMNLYVYAPKNDPYHRMCWEAPYPPEMLAEFAELARVARRSRVNFSLALSPGNTFDPGSRRHRRLLREKLGQFIDLGCTFFPLLYDDLHGFTEFNSPAAAVHAERQAELMNEVAADVTAQVKNARFLFCPTEYGTAKHSPYLSRLHELLDPRVETICTGTDGPGYQVFSHTISDSGLQDYAHNFGRKPFIWDNFNTSDWTLNRLHWSPYQGRSARLPELASGLLLNPQNVLLLNLPIFRTLGEYLKNPRRYDAQKAMQTALKQHLGTAGAKWAFALSQWFTNEIPGYKAADINLPPLTALRATAPNHGAAWQQLQHTVQPLLDLMPRAEATAVPPQWAGHLLAYCQILQWWAHNIDQLCRARSDGRKDKELENRMQQAIKELKAYSYQLPDSLMEYLEALAVSL